MDTKNALHEKKRNGKMSFSLGFRFLATVIVAMLSITIFVGGLSLYEVDQYVQTQAEDFVRVTCENEGAQINDSLSNMEKSVKIMESYLMDFFTNKEDVKDRSLQERVIKSADDMFKDVAKYTSAGGAIAYYFRLDPAISNGTSGLFYSKLEGVDEFQSLTPTDITVYEKDDTEHVGWFWQPYEAGEPVWMKPYHNQNNNMLMISYVIPMYMDDMFIGVVGMDFDYVVLSEMVHGIRLYDHGFAHLEIDGTVIHNNNYELVEKVYNDPQRYLHKSIKLVNGMTLVLSASYDDIRQIRHQISLKILFVVLAVSALFIFIAVVVVKRIVDPLKELTEASVKLSDGNYNVEIVDSNTYEIKLLSTAFKNMSVRLREREEQLRLSAHRDSLTGLRNTTSYTEWASKFDEEIAGQNAEFGVAVLDLNDLKIANDQYGHAVGNQLIVTAAKIISDVFKRSPVFRIGGDEFLVVLQNRDLEDRDNLFEQLESRCAATLVEGTITVSLAKGFAKYDASIDAHFADVFTRADDTMYENKRKIKTARSGCVNTH